MAKANKKPSGRRFVLSLGGSLIAPKEGIDLNFLTGFRSLIARQVRRGRRFIIVCGGGAPARTYQAAASGLAPASRDELDRVGIAATRLNAELVRVMFGRLSPARVVTDPRRPLPAGKPVIIGAGWEPGCSTDYDAVLLARKFGARTVVNFSNIAYVYDKDPRKFRDARPLRSLSWAEFCGRFGCRWSPGLNSPFDPVAAKEARRRGIKVVVADGRDLTNIGRILDNKEFEGTVLG